MPGRPPKPTALKLLQGTDKKHPERINHNEPKPNVGRPKRPTWLSKPARRHWVHIVEVLEEMSVLTTADGDAVGLLCNALAEYIEAAKDVELRGLILTDNRFDKDGNLVGETVKLNPSATARADAWRRVNLMMQQFGLTASSRAKIKIEKQAERDVFEEAFG